MSHKRLWVSAIIITVIIITGFVFSVPHTRDVAKISESPNVTIVPPVTLHDVFKKGMHTITGSLLTPNACTSVTATANLVGNASSTQSIRVAILMSNDTGVCLELPTHVNFSTTIAAPAYLPMTATVNGSAATTTSS